MKPALRAWSLRARLLALLVLAVLLTSVLAALLLGYHSPRPPAPHAPPGGAPLASVPNNAAAPGGDWRGGPGPSDARERRQEHDRRGPGGPPPARDGRDDRPPPEAGVPLSRLVWVALLGLIAVLPLGWLLAASVADWLARLGESARQLGSSQRHAAPLPVDGATELRTAAQAFNEMQARVERQLQDRTQMVGAMAHDLRTPLTRLAFRLEELNEPLRSRVDADMREINMMISAAMEFIRDQSHPRNHERLDMRLLVESVADDLVDMGHDVQVEAGSPITLTGDALAIKRMVSNLLDNALKYGRSARVRLSTGDAGLCQLQIDDNGPGIPEALLTRVFEPFFRVEASRSRETGGMGLGLAAVRAIVADHGGSIVLANRKNGGLRVMVQLPLGTAGAAPNI